MNQKSRPGNWSSLVISGLGVAFIVGYIFYLFFNVSYLQGPDWVMLFGLLIMSSLSFGLLYSGYWVAGSEFTGEEGWRVVIWLFAGLIGALSLTFWPIFYQRIVGVAIEDPIIILLVSGGIGANAGVLAGVYQIQFERQYQQVQRARDSLQFLNQLLRHNVLNSITIIRGNANQLISPDQTEKTVERARTIRTQSDQISDLIQNTRLLIQRIEGATETEPVDIVSTTSAVLETVQKTHEEAIIDSDLSGEIKVRADPLLSAVIENLLTNAIIHNDHEQPQVHVSLETEPRSAVLRIVDNGPGFPDSYGDKLIDLGFQVGDGLGLYLVEMLIETYGGELVFKDAQPRGTEVRVELPLADTDSG